MRLQGSGQLGQLVGIRPRVAGNWQGKKAISRPQQGTENALDILGGEDAHIPGEGARLILIQIATESLGSG